MTTDFASITVQKRTATGKGINRRLRAQGIIPAVFYTPGGQNIPVQADEAALKKLFETTGRTRIFNIEIEENGKKETAPALIWDIEYYPTKNRFQHVDFFGIDLNKEIKLRIPLEFAGTAKGTKLGGIVEAFFESLILVGKPLDLPHKVIVDISNLGLNDYFRVSDLPLPEGVHPILDANRAIVFVKDKSSGDTDSARGAE